MTLGGGNFWCFRRGGRAENHFASPSISLAFYCTSIHQHCRGSKSSSRETIRRPLDFVNRQTVACRCSSRVDEKKNRSHFIYQRGWRNVFGFADRHGRFREPQSIAPCVLFYEGKISMETRIKVLEWGKSRSSVCGPSAPLIKIDQPEEKNQSVDSFFRSVIVTLLRRPPFLTLSLPLSID